MKYIPTLHPDYEKNRAHLLAAGFTERTKALFIKGTIAVRIPFYVEDKGGYVEIYDNPANNVMRVDYLSKQCEVSINDQS